METTTSKTTTTAKKRPSHPKWWKADYDSTWERVKAALKRDWDQTRGKELNQDIGDTVKQAAGKEPIPPRDVPNPPDVDEKWEDVEPGFRFGHGARAHYGDEHPDWSDELQAKLRREWDELKTGRDWDSRRDHVRRGYEQPLI